MDAQDISLSELQTAADALMVTPLSNLENIWIVRVI